MDRRFHESPWKLKAKKRERRISQRRGLEVLMHAYEEFKPIILKRSNTAASAKARELAWQKITDRVNA